MRQVITVVLVALVALGVGYWLNKSQTSVAVAYENTVREITNVHKSSNEVVRVCNPNSDWRVRSRADAIQDIRNNLYTYIVVTRVEVGVQEREGEPYLITPPDNTELNNLQNLPDCDEEGNAIPPETTGDEDDL